jgi:hypothetical protein
MKQPKDHYVPEFYLKRWSETNPDKKLISGKYIKKKDSIQWTPRSPSGTCYERDLYGEIEATFFKPLDNDASNVLSKIESETIRHIELNLGEKDHINWATFIIGLIIRVPPKIESIENKFLDAGLDKSIARGQVPDIIQSERAIKDLRALCWVFARVETNLELITCDNPLIFKLPNLSDPDCVIVLPLSPKHFFLATRNQNLSRFPKDARKMVKNINAEIIKNAEVRIFARTRHSVKDNFIIKYWRY